MPIKNKNIKNNENCIDSQFILSNVEKSISQY